MIWIVLPKCFSFIIIAWLVGWRLVWDSWRWSIKLLGLRKLLRYQGSFYNCLRVACKRKELDGKFLAWKRKLLHNKSKDLYQVLWIQVKFLIKKVRIVVFWKLKMFKLIGNYSNKLFSTFCRILSSIVSI